MVFSIRNCLKFCVKVEVNVVSENYSIVICSVCIWLKWLVNVLVI